LAEDNPISPDPKVRALGVERMKLALDCSQAVGAEVLMGPYHSALGEFSGKGPTADEWKWGIDSMRQMAEHAGKVGVMLGVESLNRFETYLLNCIADTVKFIKEVNHPSCRMIYDTFHAHIEEKNIRDAIRLCADYIVHVHISENDRSTPGRGQVNWDLTYKTLKEVGYNGWYVVEAFGLSLPEIAAATKIWRRMFDSEDQLARDALAHIKKHTS
jgi:D-psicose/D-tagatose/L-ribulose 3-epimerase